MGRVTDGRNWLDNMKGLVVKNTFFDVAELADGSAPPMNELLHLRSLPCPTFPDSVSAHSDDAASTAGGAAASGGGGGSSPSSSVSPPSPAVSLLHGGFDEDFAASALLAEEPVQEDSKKAARAASLQPTSQDEASKDAPGPDLERLRRELGVDLRVRRTFVEYNWSEEPTLRRIASMPDLSSGNEEVEVQRAVLAIRRPLPLLALGTAQGKCQDCALHGDKSPAASWRTASSPSPSPRWSAAGEHWDEDQDQQWQMVLCCLPVEAECYVDPVQDEDDGAWPAVYDEAAFIEEQQLNSAPGAVRARRAQRRGGLFGGAGGSVGDGVVAEALQLLAEEHQAALEGYSGQIWACACRDGASSLVVQRAIAILARALREPVAGRCWRVRFDVETLLGQLRGHVLEALQHPHANHVVKQVLDTMPTDYVGFIAEELTGSAVWASRHKFGCRTVLRLTQHCNTESWATTCVEAVLSEVLDSSSELCCDEFGKFVLEELLIGGSAPQRRRVLAALRQKLMRNARHEHASFLIQRALRSDWEDAEEVAQELLAGGDAMQSLARNQFGRYVLRDLAMRSPAYTQMVRELLLPLASELQGSKQGKKLVMDLMADEGSAMR